MAALKEKLVKSLLVLFAWLRIVECNCGIPTAAEGILYLPDESESKSIYEETTKLCGYCVNETSLLVSSDPAQTFSSYNGKKCIEIVCKLGSWTGSLPRCAIPLSSVDSSGSESNSESMFKEITYYNGFVSEKDFLERNFPPYMDYTHFETGETVKEPHCVFRQGDKFQFNHSWVFDLKHDSTVAYISMNIETRRKIKELSSEPIATAFVNKIRDCKIHHIEEIKSFTFNVGLMCELQNPEDYDSNEDTVNSVLFAINLMEREKINSVCLWDFPKSCGTNEIPVDNIEFATPRCTADGVWHTLIPQPLVFCDLPSNDTYLHSNTFMLEDGVVLQYVNAKYYNQTLYAVPYTVEIHSCGDEVVGTRMCTEDGEWDSEELACSDSASTTLPSTLFLIAIFNIITRLHTN